ncbi:MAG: oxygen-independent coproporphyrinogen III oxidase [Gammaproteobacteria bacterium]|nr:oxygen-independent coproporphyrinogen III oxidase [Gammaproteobacteria bacterium]MBT8134148.1 oxygen-independent coproporphyrinogen III oxidase [Gammaproteobacteria bacterium]NNJ51177.1 oxygen-independent coproporphyrinogen III oxidase [Gammaproteobacteria bacterium]
MDNKVVFNKELIRRYDTFGPRYTSYPTAVQFTTDYDDSDYLRWVKHSNEDPIPAPLSLYLHIPFCDTICYYCGCSKLVTKDKSKAEPYIQLLKKEIRMQGALFARDREVTQIHWGGGTPTFLNDEQIYDIIACIRENFNVPSSDKVEFGIEVDPRTVDQQRIKNLANIGFNRISFGVQDFDQDVQQAVNRVQITEDIKQRIDDARTQHFQSINIDLMYGLPHQTLESFSKTLDTTIESNPDRIAIYNYAHLPEMFKPQRRIKEEDLPSPEEKLNILQLCIEKLQDAGYVYIGMDHFAKESDDLVKAQQHGSLHRNFQGYSTNADCDMIAMGVTAISRIGDNYSQNVRTIDEYKSYLDQDRIPVFRGIELEADDVLRREIINDLMCNNNLDIEKLERRWGIKFKAYFESSLEDLQQMADDGLLNLEKTRLSITKTGRLLARSICMQFDRYLQEKQSNRFSRVI